MRAVHSALLLSLLPLLPAQEQATTLAGLCDRASVIVVARSGAASEPRPEQLAVAFHAVDVLRGAVAADFALQEPAGRCCGRALFALAPGSVRLLFLEPAAGGLQPCGGDRGAVEVSGELLAHVRALLRSQGAERAEMLAQALLAHDLRVRRDAAQALAQVPAAAALGSAGRATLRTALGQGLDAETTLLPALLQAAARHAPDAVAELALPRVLAGERRELQPLLRRQLQQLPPQALADALLQRWPQHETERAAAAELLAPLPAEVARPLQLRLLHEAEAPGTALPLCEALLRQGLPRAQLQQLAPAAVLQLAAGREARAPAFRCIQLRR